MNSAIHPYNLTYERCCVGGQETNIQAFVCGGGLFHLQIITIIISYVAFYFLGKTGLLGKELPLP